jgi:LIM domain-binding protein 1
MGGEFGEEDERMISRLENAQYDPAAAAAQAQGSIGPMDPDYVGGPSGWPGGPSGPPPPPLPSSSGHQPKLEQDIKKSPKNC